MTPLAAQRQTLITYLLLMVEREDWHGVRDAAADLEKLDVRIEERAHAGV
jgi:hypothetical protein